MATRLRWAGRGSESAIAICMAKKANRCCIKRKEGFKNVACSFVATAGSLPCVRQGSEIDAVDGGVGVPGT